MDDQTFLKLWKRPGDECRNGALIRGGRHQSTFLTGSRRLTPPSYVQTSKAMQMCRFLIPQLIDVDRTGLHNHNHGPLVPREHVKQGESTLLTNSRLVVHRYFGGFRQKLCGVARFGLESSAAASGVMRRRCELLLGTWRDQPTPYLGLNIV
jgi:hypothetical protein